AHFQLLSDGPGNEGAARGKLAAPSCIEVLDPEARRSPKHEYRTKDSAWMLQVVNCLRSGAHPSGPSGSHHFCSLASSQCAVLARLMGGAPAATAAAVQSLCSAALPPLWGLRGWPTGLRGLSPTRKAPFPPPEGTAQRSREGAAPGLLPRAAGHAAQGCHGQGRGDG